MIKLILKLKEGNDVIEHTEYLGEKYSVQKRIDGVLYDIMFGAFTKVEDNLHRGHEIERKPVVVNYTQDPYAYMYRQFKL
jgi:hypothetical protein